MKSWQTVFKTKLSHQAEIVKDILVGENIPAVVMNQQDYAYKIGHFEVRVESHDVMQAVRIIENDIQFDHE